MRPLLGLPAVIAIGAAAPPASAYDLFHPKPAGQLRELSADRPGATEGPYTVDAGHVQLETELVGWTRDADGGERAGTWTFASSNLRVGLLDALEAQLLFDPLLATRVEHADGGSTRGTGLGEVVARAKWNLWGNDGGRSALALQPFVQLPLAASDTREGVWKGGLITPFALAPDGPWSAGAHARVGFVEDRDGGVDVELEQALTVGRSLGERLASYVEFIARMEAHEPDDWQGTVGGGFSLLLGPNLQLDVGCDVGVTDAAPDVHPFVGLTVRR